MLIYFVVLLTGGTPQHFRQRKNVSEPFLVEDWVRIRLVWWFGLRLLIFSAPVAAGLQKSERGPFGCRCPNLRRTSRRAHKFGRLPQLQLGCICRRQRLAFVVPRLFRPQDAPRLRSSTGLEQVRLCYVRAKQKPGAMASGFRLVDGTGLEPVTSCTSSRCSTS